MREITAAVDLTLGASISCKTPSIRNLIFKVCSKGSTWMSEALVSMARCIIKLTILITGASLAKSFKCAKSSSPNSSPRSFAARSSISLSIFDRSSPYCTSRAASISDNKPTLAMMAFPDAKHNAAIEK